MDKKNVFFLVLLCVQLQTIFLIHYIFNNNKHQQKKTPQIRCGRFLAFTFFWGRMVVNYSVLFFVLQFLLLKFNSGSQSMINVIMICLLWRGVNQALTVTIFHFSFFQVNSYVCVCVYWLFGCLCSCTNKNKTVFFRIWFYMRIKKTVGQKQERKRTKIIIINI